MAVACPGCPGLDVVDVLVNEKLFQYVVSGIGQSLGSVASGNVSGDVLGNASFAHMSIWLSSSCPVVAKVCANSSSWK